jgi:hypothetical protein
MLLPLWGIANVHPITILFNLFMGPVIGFVLFPLALCLLFAPWLTPLFDKLIFILRKSAPWIDSSWVVTVGKNSDLAQDRPLSQFILWGLLLLLHLCLHLYQTRAFRKQIQK